MQRKQNDMSSFKAIHKRTIAVYETHAAKWDDNRTRTLREKSWLDKLIQLAQPGVTLLDVGCGAGEPISRYFIEKNCSLTGVDSSPAMIDICKSRFPNEEWIVMDMRELALGKLFDGIIAWDSFFHLNQDEQRNTLQRFFQHLHPDGALLLTVGHEAGEVLGSVAGNAVYHSSLSAREYKRILGSAGFQDIEMAIEDETCDRTVLLAKRRGRLLS